MFLGGEPSHKELELHKIFISDGTEKTGRVFGVGTYADKQESMTQLLEHHLRNWIEKHFQPNPDGYLFINSNGRRFSLTTSSNTGLTKTMKRLGIDRPQRGVHVGIHCFRHGVTTELLEAGTPMHLVTRMM